MGSFLFFAFSWWAIALRIVAIIHFIRRRPDFFWIWVILFHWVGALVYIFVEVIPDAGLLRSSFQVFPRRRRIHELERAILDNPSAGNYEELGLLYLDDENFARARACYDKSISSRTDSVDPFYRRGIAEVELGDFAAAVPDLERAVSRCRLRFSSRQGIAGLGVRADRTKREGQRDVSRGGADFDDLGNVLPLRAVSGIAGTECRGAGVGEEDSG